MIKGIHHAAISTSDLDRSLKFYRDLLGFKVTFELDFGEGDEVLQRLMALGGKRLVVWRCSEPTMPSSNSFNSHRPHRSRWKSLTSKSWNSSSATRSWSWRRVAVVSRLCAKAPIFAASRRSSTRISPRLFWPKSSVRIG